MQVWRRFAFWARITPIPTSTSTVSIFGNGTCPGGVVVAKGNARTVLTNNLIYGNGQNGVTFGAGQGGPNYVVGNTIHGNGHNGVSFDRLQEVWLVNNVITQI